jgi:ribonucleotide reductase alpha subunit
MDTYQEYIAASRYARWDYDKSRRETWPETVDRYIKFWSDRNMLPEKDAKRLTTAIRDLHCMPSMRCLMTAGEALARDNVAGFNCSYLSIDHPRAFDELMYILLCGTGVGYSVENQFVSKLPEVEEEFHVTDTTINVADSKVGWAKAFRELLSLLWVGQIPMWDISNVRPAGAPLRTFGGRASGPEPLVELFEFTIDLFRRAAGRKLTTLECHDLCCKIAEIVVVGGVRRSALISLSDPSDRAMAEAKSVYVVDEYNLVNETEEKWVYALTMKRHPAVRPTYKVEFSKTTDFDQFQQRQLEYDKKIYWSKIEPQRALANNSACYEQKPDYTFFLDEMNSLYKSYSGERGMFSREASINVAKRNERRETENILFGTNPCFSGDTLVAVADGRNAVSIKDLAKENRPFPVYSAARTHCGNQYGSSTTFSHWKDEVKTGIAFKTGTKQLLKVTLSTGDTFRCTPEHKLALPNGEYIEAKDSLGVQLHRFFTVKDKYRRINTIDDAHKNQHRMIWEHFNGEIPKGMVIDHVVSGSKDFVDNLQMMTKQEHDKKTSAEMKGLNNPVYRIEDTEAWKQNLSNAMFLYNNPHFMGITNEELIHNGKRLIDAGEPITLKNLKKLDDRTPSSLPKNRFGGKISNLRKICLGEIVYKEHKRVPIAAKNANIYPHVIDEVVVTNIVKDGIEDVYDIKVQDNSNFYIITSTFDEEANNSRGILVHNCSEIILRPYQFCNLSEVVVRKDDTLEDLKRKVADATILGTFQSTLTDFRYLRKIWKKNTEEERLLGVSLTGIMDHPILNGSLCKDISWFFGEKGRGPNYLAEALEELKQVSVDTNVKWAKKLNINPSVAITCVKPSGTVSQLVNSASGIHPRFSEYYIRTVRADVKDPLAQYMRDAGFPCEPDIMKESNLVFSFPIKSPSSAIFANNVGALEQLKLWSIYQKHWCEHKPSITVYYKDEEFLEVFSWIWKNFDSVSGISLLPYSDHVYKQAPYQNITKEEYEEALKKMPSGIDWEEAAKYEHGIDSTTGSGELACTAGACEL